MAVDFRPCPQKRESRHHIIELLRRHQDKFQMLASLFSFRCLLALQHVLKERCLVRRKALAAAKRKKESVPVFYKYRRQPLSSLSDWDSSCMSSIGPARAVIEQHGGKWTRPVWHPKESFELQIPASELNCLQRDVRPQ
jgi:hypothetical protein